VKSSKVFKTAGKALWEVVKVAGPLVALAVLRVLVPDAHPKIRIGSLVLCL